MASISELYENQKWDELFSAIDKERFLNMNMNELGSKIST